MKALFEDNTPNNSTKQVAGKNSKQKSIFSDSHYDPDDWVDIPNDELMWYEYSIKFGLSLQIIIMYRYLIIKHIAHLIGGKILCILLS